jgi:hypothetical protein
MSKSSIVRAAGPQPSRSSADKPSAWIRPPVGLQNFLEVTDAQRALLEQMQDAKPRLVT